jgi:hypothetical protein
MIMKRLFRFIALAAFMLPTFADAQFTGPGAFGWGAVGWPLSNLNPDGSIYIYGPVTNVSVMYTQGITVTNGITNNSATASTVAYFNANKQLVSGASYSGGALGTGTVTSVSGDGIVEAGTITTSGSFTLANAGANTVLANAAGSAAAPAYSGNPAITNLTALNSITNAGNLTNVGTIYGTTEDLSNALNLEYISSAGVLAVSAAGAVTETGAPAVSGANLTANTIPLASLAQQTGSTFLVGNGASAITASASPTASGTITGGQFIDNGGSANTVVYFNGSKQLTAGAAYSGATIGTVTSVSADGTVESGTVTTSGSFTLANAAANSVLDNPTASSAAPVYTISPNFGGNVGENTLIVTNKLTNSQLTASEPVVTDANKALASVTYAAFLTSLGVAGDGTVENTALSSGALTLANAGPNTGLFNPTGGAAAPVYTGNPNLSNVACASLLVTNNITNSAASASTVAYFNANKVLTSGGSYTGGTLGTVTSVSGDGTVESGTVTTSGTFSLANASANSGLNNPTASSAAPVYTSSPHWGGNVEENTLIVTNKLTNSFLTVSEPVVTASDDSLASVSYTTFAGSLSLGNIGGTLGLSQLASQASDTIVMNNTGGSAAPTAVAYATAVTALGVCNGGDGTVENTALTSSKLTLVNAGPNTVLANATGSAATPSYVGTIDITNVNANAVLGTNNVTTTGQGNASTVGFIGNGVNITNVQQNNLVYTTYNGYLGSTFFSGTPSGAANTNWQLNFLTNVWNITFGTNDICISNLQASTSMSYPFVTIYLINTNTSTTHYFSIESNYLYNVAGGGASAVASITNSVLPFIIQLALPPGNAIGTGSTLVCTIINPPK